MGRLLKKPKTHLPLTIGAVALLAFVITSCQLLTPLPQQTDGIERDLPHNIFTDVVPGQPISDEIAVHLLNMLYAGDEHERENAIEAILTARDRRFVPVLIELQRFAQIGLVPGEFREGSALEQLSGQSFGGDWSSWIEWYGQTDLEPPPGFTTWKGKILSEIDPGFGEFLQDRFASTIRVEEIQWGGVRVDGIPALDQPRMLAPGDATYIAHTDPVFGLEINGDARAYPLSVMDWHEMANDTVGGVPVSIAYCTLCGAAIAYDGRASDGAIYDFGSSGFLFRSNKLMYDRQTRSLWNQMTGEPVLGELVGTDLRLDTFPIVLTTWGSWLEQHPGTAVLDVNTGFQRPYGVGVAYGHYFSDAETMFPVWQRSQLLDTKEQIYAMRVEDIPVAYPLGTLDAEQVVNDRVGETNLVLVAQRGIVQVEGVARRAGPVSYPAGSEVRAYERGQRAFFPGSEPGTVTDEDGQTWSVTEAALMGPNGEELPRLSGHLAYWFGWFAFFPETLVYGEQG